MARSSFTCAAFLAAVAVLLCLAAAAPALSAAAPAVPSGAAAASSRYAPPPLPAFEMFFAQQFRVSVMTQSYGVFNATLRMRGSMNFPERVHGELIPLGEPRVNRQTQTVLPHFKRVRGVEDDKLSDLPFTATKAGGADKNSAGSAEFTTAGEEERPSLLVLDMQLLHSDATQGKAQMYYLPAELMALRSHREAMGEGSVAPAAMVDFAFRFEASQMSNNPLSDTPELARMSAASVVMGSQTSLYAAVEESEDVAAGSRGDVIFRWITEHEFSATFALPMASAAGKDGAASTHLERVWVYGYATPSAALFDRKQRQVPWYNKYLMIGVALMGFLVQVISGWTEGKTKALKQAELEEKQKSKEQAKLEAALKEQERMNKKKK